MGVKDSFKTIVKSISKGSIYSKMNDLKKQLRIMTDGILKGGSSDYWGTGNLLVYPKFPYGNNSLYDLSYNSDTLTIIHNALRREMFRKGFELVHPAKIGEDEEGQTEQDEETTMVRQDILDFLKEVNENNQNITDVFMMLEDDLSIMDDAFMVFYFDYEYDERTGKQESRKLSQIKRGDPRFMGLVMNRYDRPGYNDDDEKVYACPVHREVLMEGENRCSTCGLLGSQAYYFSNYGNELQYYFEDEVIYKSKYRPSPRRGYSPVLSVWQKTRTLLFMDKYIMELYDGQRPPKAGLFFQTSNQAGLKAAWDDAKQRADENPHMPIVMAVPDGVAGGESFVKFIDFMKGLDELQHTDMRNEYRRQMGAVYGVEPVFQGDISTSGGLNNEGLQVTVTNRVVEFGQSIYNTHFWPGVLNAMGALGWIAHWNPNEEQDEMAAIQRQTASLDNGAKAVSLGLDASYDEKQGEVVVRSGELTEPISFNPFGGSSADVSDTGMSGSPDVKMSESSKEFKMILKAANQRPAFTGLEKTLKREVEKVTVKFKDKNPSPEELSKAMADINLNLQKEMKDSQGRLFRKTYKFESEKIGRTLGKGSTSFGIVDEGAIAVLNNQKVLSDAYAGLSQGLVDKTNSVINQAFNTPGGLSVSAISKRLEDAIKVADFRAERIARVETAKVSSAARKNTYAKEDDFAEMKFKHIGPTDDRTTSTSKNITARTAKGVSWNDYVSIVTEEASKEFPTWTVDKDFPVSHWSSRHSFVRIVNV